MTETEDKPELNAQSVSTEPSPEGAAVILDTARKTLFYVLVFGVLLLFLACSLFPSLGYALYHAAGAEEAAYSYAVHADARQSGKQGAKAKYRCVNLSDSLFSRYMAADTKKANTYAKALDKHTAEFLTDLTACAFLPEIDRLNRENAATLEFKLALFSYRNTLFSLNARARAYLGLETPYFNGSVYQSGAERLLSVDGNTLDDDLTVYGQLLSIAAFGVPLPDTTAAAAAKTTAKFALSLHDYALSFSDLYAARVLTALFSALGESTQDAFTFTYEGNTVRIDAFYTALYQRFLTV